MSDTIKQAGIKQADGTYQMKDIGVDYQNVDGLATAATAFKAKSADKATGDKNNKDITTYVASISKNAANIRTTNGAGTTSDVSFAMTGATPTANGAAGFVPAPTKADNAKFLKGDGSWATPQDTTYSGSTNINVNSSNVIDLKNTAVSSGTYGPSANVTGSNGVTISVPKFTVDAKGRLTSAGTQTYTSVDTTYSAGTGLRLSGTSFSLGSHASTGTGYGQGSGSNFGHVKLNDTYASLVSGADAAGGVAASQNALYNAYNTLNGNLTPGLGKYSSAGDPNLLLEFGEMSRNRIFANANLRITCKVALPANNTYGLGNVYPRPKYRVPLVILCSNGTTHIGEIATNGNIYIATSSATPANGSFSFNVNYLANEKDVFLY